ncbi:hypothetical protein RGQ15_07135 [Paracoccus sp. MBLB3053]|uniref:DUF3168 domain-containing protein n=1 Tax=Paracoccus aurantius TaxID=3073814 RepID=A0ABU2HQM3_9RHOB|nr:hypothetical protein [Paracoccus sp. MBLB3053]MDS9467347.1 hypothetical protein [Paracoccus sp. MBLB3053]
MAHFRSEYRALVRAALRDHARFADFTILKVWPGSIDAATLPVLGVLTPQDRCEQETMTSTSRRTLLQVAARRAGHDEVEDVLDADSEIIEAVVNAAIRGAGISCFLDETSVVSNTMGERHVGTLVMSFRLTLWCPPATLPDDTAPTTP